jgi:hypothetical protein
MVYLREKLPVGAIRLRERLGGMEQFPDVRTLQQHVTTILSPTKQSLQVDQGYKKVHI